MSLGNQICGHQEDPYRQWCLWKCIQVSGTSIFCSSPYPLFIFLYEFHRNFGAKKKGVIVTIMLCPRKKTKNRQDPSCPASGFIAAILQSSRNSLHVVSIWSCKVQVLEKTVKWPVILWKERRCFSGTTTTPAVFYCNSTPTSLNCLHLGAS